MNWDKLINGINGVGNALGGVSDSIGQISNSTSTGITSIFDSLSSKPIVKTENVVDVGWKTWVGIAALAAVIILVFKRKN